jgi:hypothetical protein
MVPIFHGAQMRLYLTSQSLIIVQKYAHRIQFKFIIFICNVFDLCSAKYKEKVTSAPRHCNIFTIN